MDVLDSGCPWVFGGRLRQVSSTGAFTQGLSVDFLALPNCGSGLTRSTYADPGATVPGVQGSYVQYSGSVPTDPLPGGGPTQSVLLSYQLFSTFGTTTVFASTTSISVRRERRRSS